MIVACEHCGAPLDIEEGKTVVACDFCKKKNQVANLKPPAPIAPPVAPPVVRSDQRPPPQTRPPEDAELAGPPTDWVRLRRRLRIAAVVIVLGIAAIIYAVHMHGSTVEDIANLPLESTPNEIDRKLNVTWRTDDSARVTFRSGAAGPYEHVNYRWDGKDFSLPESISLFVIEGSKIGPNVIPTLAKSLNGGVDEGGSWRWGATSVHVDPVTGAIHLEVKAKLDDGKPNLLRKRQLQALWQIVRNAAFGGGPEIPRAELVAVLGGGYSPTKLGAFDPTTKFAAARGAIPTTFPGALAPDATSFDIALDHPYLRSVALSWDNRAEGDLMGVHFRVSPAYLKQKSGFVGCLTKELGAPEVKVTDFSKGTKMTTFHVPALELGSGLDIDVGDEASLYILAHYRFETSTWKKAFDAFDHCR